METSVHYENVVNGDSTQITLNLETLKKEKKVAHSCWEFFRCGTHKVSVLETDTMPTQNGNAYHNDEMGTSAAYMPVSKNNPLYNMNHPNRGKAVIFNFDKWDVPKLKKRQRYGSVKDRDDLEKCLKALDFEVELCNNLTKNQFLTKLASLRDEDHKMNDCLVVAIMSHGEKNNFYVNDGYLIPLSSIWNHFEANCSPTLAGKPKIFIIQACRGEKYDSGTTLEVKRNPSKSVSNFDATDSGTFSYVIPNAADIFVAFSCPLGYYSWRDSDKGSWFIQSICKVLTEHGQTLELIQLFTIVAKQVSLKSSSTNRIKSNEKKQVPSTSSTLIRDVYFKPKPTTNPPIRDEAHQTSTTTVVAVHNKEDEIPGTSGNSILETNLD